MHRELESRALPERRGTTTRRTTLRAGEDRRQPEERRGMAQAMADALADILKAEARSQQSRRSASIGDAE